MNPAEIETLLHRIDKNMAGIESDVKALSARYDKTEKILTGNGKPGLVDEVNEIKSAQKSCAARAAFAEGRQNLAEDLRVVREAQLSCPARAAFADGARARTRADIQLWLMVVSLLISLVLSLKVLTGGKAGDAVRMPQTLGADAIPGTGHEVAGGGNGTGSKPGL